MPQIPPHRRVMLVRHGHYVRDGRQGDPDYALSPLGRSQARQTGKRLLDVLSATDAKVVGLFCSPWARARETAEIVGRELGLSSIRAKRYLHEVAPLPPPNSGMPSPPPDARKQAVAHVARFRARFLSPPERNEIAVVVSHGNLIRYIVTAMLGLPFESWVKFDIAHASITELRTYAGGIETVVSYGETAHLPPPMITTV